MSCYTRNQIIDIWREDKKHLNFYVCPDCHDILTSMYNSLYCMNKECLNLSVYDMKGLVRGGIINNVKMESQG